MIPAPSAIEAVGMVVEALGVMARPRMGRERVAGAVGVGMELR
jgi:hypothetical protein